MLHLFKGQSRLQSNAIRKIDISLEAQLEKKMFFLQLHKEDIERIKAIASILDEYAPVIAKRHYDMICQLPETKGIMQQYSSEQKFIATYEAYVRSLSSFEPNEQYVANRKRIGKVHAQIQLTTGWFVASFTRFYEVLVPVIIQRQGAAKSSETIISLQKLLMLDAQIALEAYQEAHEFHFVETNAEIIESLIEVDQVRELLDSVDHSMQTASDISTAAEQLAASVQDISRHATSVAENSEDMVTSARQSQQSIHEALNGFSQLVNDMRQMRQQFIGLNEAVAQMTDVAGFINEVADQTKLLALNAAIEAARAGEEGRGFAVVANEVRKLSEQTSHSVGQIKTMIESVQTTANQVDVMTVNIEQNMVEQGETTQEAIEQLELIIGQMVDMGTTTTNIAAIIEQQTAATDDIADRTTDLLNHFEVISRNATETGQKIYDVSYGVNALRNDTLSYMGKISDDHMIRIVKTDHLLWRWWVYNSILGYHTLDVEQAGDAEACRLGQWYNRLRNNEQMKHNELFLSIDAPHKEIHKQVSAVDRYLQAGDRAGALKQLERIESISQEVVTAIDRLYRSMSAKR